MDGTVYFKVHVPYLFAYKPISALSRDPKLFGYQNLLEADYMPATSQTPYLVEISLVSILIWCKIRSAYS